MTDMLQVHEPGWVKQVDATPAFDLDADRLLQTGEYPLSVFQLRASALKPLSGGVLRSTFDPTPLERAMRDGGFECWQTEGPNGEYRLRIWRRSTAAVSEAQKKMKQPSGCFWCAHDGLHLDVRHLPAPMPMIAIFQFLDSRAQNSDIIIHLHEFPMHLLPELGRRHINWQVISEEPGETVLRLHQGRQSHWSDDNGGRCDG